ncbi:hypothetical protein [Mesorhizobium sp. 2RAF21]|uniref:hypothetical protein n=1 Tax=Mesorhizobium sp. 2RAF21 TaxID=3232995 RepID=UPI003F952ABF
MTTLAEAVEKLGQAGRSAFLAVGQQEVREFVSAPQHFHLVRSVVAVDRTVELPNAEYILARSPFSGRDPTRVLGLPVVMVTRPEAAGGARVFSVDEVLRAMDHLLSIPAERGE